ncbi:Sulfate transporter [Halotydeus destructor]|nr:Sulfate transporter [Halotydeus destructor]
MELFFKLFPFFKWISFYDLRENLIPDVVVGLTVAVLHIPQGMAYALLAGVSPVTGLYVALFPAFIYVVMGTSRHVSIGIFAIVSLMMKSALVKIEDANIDTTPEQAGATMSLLVGAILILARLAHLGSLSVILSDKLISAFSCAASFHVATSQLSNLLGFSIPSPEGRSFKMFRIWFNCATRISQEIKWPTFAVSLITISLLVSVKSFIQPILNRKWSTTIPVPIDLIVIIAATVSSKYFAFQANHSIDIIGHLPSGLPRPSLPRLDTAYFLLPDACAIAMVSYAIGLSLAKIFARRHRYEIDANQELLALGTADIFGSFFGCYPCAAALARSMVLERAGGKTQVTSLVASSLILIVLLYVGPFMYHLPLAILSSVLLVASKGLLLQLGDLTPTWKISKSEGTVWLITFSSVIVFGVDGGLIIGILANLVGVLLTMTYPKSAILNVTEKGDALEDAELNPTVKIFRFSGPINYLNREHVKDRLFEHTLGLSANQIVNQRSHVEKMKSSHQTHVVLIDCSLVSTIDSSAIDALHEIVETFKKLHIKCHLVACSKPVVAILIRSNFLEKVKLDYDLICNDLQSAILNSNNS